MYNGIGLSTARGTGTNGYVQANLSNLLFSKNRVQYNSEADIAKAESEVNRLPNAELLDHEYKRSIEIKCVEFEDLMEGKGFTDDEIKNKVDEYRKLLYYEFESGKMNIDNNLDIRNSHSRAKVAKHNRDRMRSALGIDAAFVDGSSLEKIKKTSELIKAEVKDKADLNKEMEKSLMEKLLEKMKQKKLKNGKHNVSSSSSSSSTSSISSDDSSNSDFGTSSSSNTSSSSSDSEDNKRMQKSNKKISKNKKDAVVKVKKELPSPPLKRRRSDERRRNIKGGKQKDRSRSKDEHRKRKEHSRKDESNDRNSFRKHYKD